jgi:hypothetical protein
MNQATRRLPAGGHFDFEPLFTSLMLVPLRVSMSSDILCLDTTSPKKKVHFQPLCLRRNHMCRFERCDTLMSGIDQAFQTTHRILFMT